LKQGLGVKNAVEVRKWFLKHPDVGLAFDQMNGELEIEINRLQTKAINGLRDICIEELKFNNLSIGFDKEPEDVNMKPDNSWIKKEKK